MSEKLPEAGGDQDGLGVLADQYSIQYELDAVTGPVVRPSRGASLSKSGGFGIMIELDPRFGLGL